MACIDRQVLGRYFDGELDERSRRDVEVHLASCVGCTGELNELRMLRDGIRAAPVTTVPDGLWPAIERQLASPGADGSGNLRPRYSRMVFLRKLAVAACLALLLGAAVIAGLWFGNGETAQAASIDFSALLDAVNADALDAFERFLERYGGAAINAADAHRSAPALDFEVPAELPGGFLRKNVYWLRFGDADGIAAAYRRADGEFLAAIFHPPVRSEHFGTHQDYPCAIGKHRGHAVQVGEWRMVHLTDPTTCHCVLSRLDPVTELPAVMAEVAPRSANDAAADD